MRDMTGARLPGGFCVRLSVVLKPTFGRIALAMLLALTACESEDHHEAATRLISSFQGGCSTSGRWTEAALSHNQALISILEELKEHEHCKPYRNTLVAIQNLHEQVALLLKDESYSEYRLAEEKLQELTLALSGVPSGSPLETALSEALVLTQVDLAQKRAAKNSSQDSQERDRFARSTLQFATYMQSILEQTDGLAGCLHSSPGAAVQLGTNLLAIGGSFISPIYGAGAAVVGQLINVGVDFVRSLGTDEKIWNLHSAQMPIALSCGLESMTELYCNANDAFELLELQSKSYSSPGANPAPIWRGLDLLGRRLPVLNQWLLSVKNGVTPTDPTEANRQNAVWKKVQQLENITRVIHGNISQSQKFYEAAAADASVQRDILFKAIRDNAYYLVYSGSDEKHGSTPFLDKSSDPMMYACWLSLGVNTLCPIKEQIHTGNLEGYIRDKLLSDPRTSMAGLFSNWEGVFDSVKNQVDIEFAQTITSDPLKLIAAAKQAPADNVSPREALKMTQAFLQEMKTRTRSNPQLTEILDSTIALISNALTIIDDDSGSSSVVQRITTILNLFELKKGLQFFNERISSFIQWDLQEKIARGELPSDAADILKSAGADIRARLTASGVRNLDRVSLDLNKSRSLMERNIGSFREFFTHSFAESIEALSAAALKAGEPERGANRPNGQILGQLCTLLLATDSKWPQEISWEICSHATLDSVYPDPDNKISIELSRLSSELEGKTFQKRACAMQRFLRAGRLAEIIKPSSISSALWDSPNLIPFLTH